MDKILQRTIELFDEYVELSNQQKLEYQNRIDAYKEIIERQHETVERLNRRINALTVQLYFSEQR